MRKGTKDNGQGTRDQLQKYFWSMVVGLLLVHGPWSFVLGPVFAAPDVAAIEKSYQTIGTLKADFVQTTPVMLTAETQTRPGRLFYKDGGKLRIEYAGDRMMHYIVSENTLYMVDPVLNEIKIYQLKESGLPEEALNFLANLGHLSDYFDVTYDKKDRLVLKSKTKSSYKALYCRFNKDNLLESLSIVNKSGNNTDYRFFNIQTGIDLSNKLFKP